MNGHQAPPGTVSRRRLLAVAAGGVIAAATGLTAVPALARSGPGPATGTVRPAPRASGVNIVGPIIPGVDYSWGRPRPSALRAAGFLFASRYLSYDTSGKNLTRPEANALIAAGVDIVSNWENTANEALQGYSRGATSARDAQSQALACGMPADRPIYFSIDFNATLEQQAAIDAYFDGVASVLGRARTGAYGGFSQIGRLFDNGKITWGWQTYAWSAGQWDSRAQLRQVLNGITVDGADCDRDEARVADFGQWGHP